MKTIKILLILFMASLSFTSCEDFEAEMDVDYNENPTVLEVVGEEMANQLFRRWFVDSNSYNGPGLMLTTAADMNTCSWGNQGMKDVSSEPRVVWDNSPTYGYADATEDYHVNMYGIMHDANSIIAAMESGILEPTDPNMTKCYALFGQGVSIGYLSLLFDQVWITDETGVLNDGSPVSYSVSMDYALSKIDDAIAIANDNSFTVEIVNGHTMTSTEFAQFLNSLAARLIVNNVRNSTERDAIDWAKVQAYAENGITSDFNVLGDEWKNWPNEWSYYSIYPGWGRVDMRVIHLLDPSTIDYWTSDDPVAPESSSADARLVSDFEYLTSQDFVPSRGLYHYSSYRHSRYDADAHGGDWAGENHELLKAENDLYLAEAYLRQDDPVSAAAVINASSRVLRGGLAPVGTTATEVADALHYERSVELLTTGMGLGFFEMRRENMLQAGTPLHFPIPGGQILNTPGMENYTFGGTTGIAGQDYSESGWH